MGRKYNKEELLSKLRDMSAREIAGKAITGASDVSPYLEQYGYADVEYFIVLTVDGAHNVIKIHEVTKGILSKVVIHPREVFRAAISDGAAAVILAHNHPSGQLVPSEEDKAITKRLKSAGEIIGITVLDHVIIGKNGSFFSFVQAGLEF